MYLSFVSNTEIIIRRRSPSTTQAAKHGSHLARVQPCLQKPAHEVLPVDRADLLHVEEPCHGGALGGTKVDVERHLQLLSELCREHSPTLYGVGAYAGGEVKMEEKGGQNKARGGMSAVT